MAENEYESALQPASKEGESDRENTAYATLQLSEVNSTASFYHTISFSSQGQYSGKKEEGKAHRNWYRAAAAIPILLSFLIALLAVALALVVFISCDCKDLEDQLHELQTVVNEMRQNLSMLQTDLLGD